MRAKLNYKKIRLLRSEYSEEILSQTELAKRIGISQNQISRIEKGERRLTLEHFIKLCKTLDVEPAAMINFLSTDDDVPMATGRGSYTVSIDPMKAIGIVDQIFEQLVIKGYDEQELRTILPAAKRLIITIRPQF